MIHLFSSCAQNRLILTYIVSNEVPDATFALVLASTHRGKCFRNQTILVWLECADAK